MAADLCLAGTLRAAARQQVLRGLGQLGLPRPFLAQVQLLYRYLFLLVEEGRRISQARALREPNRKLPRLSVARRMVSSLLWRTWERGERVYLCMKVRGFDGRLPALAPTRFRPADALFVTTVLAACVAARLLPIAEWLGQALLGGVAA